MTLSQSTTIGVHQSRSGSFAAINLACGGKLCHQPGWINADHAPSNQHVMRVNLLKSLPFPDHHFDVVYHSQFIEHLTEESAVAFLRECQRILKPGGIMRLVTPDLQNQAAEYLTQLSSLLSNPDDRCAQLRYQWIRLEMLDQLTRHTSGGAMATFLNQHGREIRSYLIARMGRSGVNLIPSMQTTHASQLKSLFLRVRQLISRANAALTPSGFRVGSFRLSGEPHLCMYDAYLLKQTLSTQGFVSVRRVSAVESSIPDWSSTRLDTDEQGNADCGTSLFMEATKA